jgi:hypothetical protein
LADKSEAINPNFELIPMDQIKDVWQSLKERFSSPYWGAVIIAWVIFNYDIVIALIWYDKDIWLNSSSATVIIYIQNKLSWDRSLLYPTLSGIFYTLLMPITKNLIQAYIAWSRKWGGNWVFKISDESSVSLGKYFKLKEQVKNQMEQLKDSVKEESEYIEQINTLNNTIIGKDKDINILNVEINTLKTQVDIPLIPEISFLDGEWENNFTMDKKTRVEQVKITNGHYYIRKGSDRVWHQVAEISLFSKQGNQIQFVKDLSPSYVNELRRTIPTFPKHLYNDLIIQVGGDMVGFENENVRIKYVRKNKEIQQVVAG